MTNSTTISTQRAKDLLKLYSYLDKLPLSYMGNLHLHSIVKKYPLVTILKGRHLENDDYNRRIKKWIIESLEKSPHLNN